LLKKSPPCCRSRWEPFRYYQYGERIVHLDGCVEVEAAYYGAPPGWIGRVQWDELYVRLLDPKTGQLLREHVRQKRGWYRIKEEDHPRRTHCAPRNCCGAPVVPDRTSARSATPFAACKARLCAYPGRSLFGQEVWHGSGR